MNRLFNEEPTVVIERGEITPHPLINNHQTTGADLLGTEQLIDDLSIYGNPLLNAATELLGALVALPRQGPPNDIERFRQRLLDAMITFKERGIHLDYHPSVVEKSCFVMCAALDEAILYTAWGERTRWENRSLLSKVFSQRNGGEIFFQLLDKACQQPAKLVDFIELQYVLLMLGFQGKYRHNDQNLLHEIKSDVYAIIRNYRTDSKMPVPETPDLPRGRLPWHMLSAGKTLALVLIVLSVVYAGSEYWYHIRSKPLIEQFSTLNREGGFAHTHKDLVFVSNDSDLGLAAESAPGEVITARRAQEKSVQWEIQVAVFSKLADALKLVNELKPYGYQISTKDTTNGVEVLLKAGDNLPTIRKLKNELNVRFGLNSTIRKAPK